MFQLWHQWLATWLTRRLPRLEATMREPARAQELVLLNLLKRAESTVIGRLYGFGELKSAVSFRQNIPIQAYEALFPYIERALKGEPNVLWPGHVHWFAKSSGTTNDKSKFIPLTQASLNETHYAAGRDMLALYLAARPDSHLFTGKSLSIGGSHELSRYGPQARAGDLSAILIQNMPTIFELLRTPSRSVALMPEWESKMAAMAAEAMQANLTGMVGVPTWTLLVLRKIQERFPTRPLPELWPHLELFIHGGISFKPYRAQFEALLPTPSMRYLETYNASEGFFAVQDDLSRSDMLLLLDHGIYYEFIPLDQLENAHPQVFGVGEVVLHTNYAMAISTNGGLWRYLIGDTVRFTSLIPARIQVTGRTKHFLNAFGEELVIENADTAVAEASFATGAVVTDYTAAPIYFEEGANGGHEWLIEFAVAPASLTQFVQVMDSTLKRLNSDYEAKRHKDIAMRLPVVHAVPNGSFYNWLKMRGKLGGQNKVPRLSNDRNILEAILASV